MSARLRYWFEQTHSVRLYLGYLVIEVGLRPRRYRQRWGIGPRMERYDRG